VASVTWKLSLTSTW